MTDPDDEQRSRAERVLTQVWPGSALVSLTSLTGHSGLTLRATVSGRDAPSDVVLKLCPSGREPLGRHDVVRQARLLAELKALGSVPVPDVLFVDDSPPPTVVLSWVPGEAAEPVLELKPGARDPDELRQRARGAARTLAQLHSIPVADLDSTRDERVWSPGDELERWKPTMDTVDPELRPGADGLYTALASASPDPSPPTIVHGDFRLGNILCDREAIGGVIDWEIWSIGDPRVDLGWFRIMSAPDDLPGIVTSTDGLLTEDDLLAEYEQQRGQRIVGQRWFDALARYKMAAIMGNNLRRHRSGRRADPYQESLTDTIPTLIRSGIKLLDG